MRVPDKKDTLAIKLTAGVSLVRGTDSPVEHSGKSQGVGMGVCCFGASSQQVAPGEGDPK